MKSSKDITAATNISCKHVWRYVRRAGIEPQNVNGTLFITDEQFKAFVGMVKSGELETKPVNKPKKKAKPKAQITITERSATDAELAANREKIAAQQSDKVKPVVLSTTAVPAWWGPFGAK